MGSLPSNARHGLLSNPTVVRVANDARYPNLTPMALSSVGRDR